MLENYQIAFFKNFLVKFSEHHYVIFIVQFSENRFLLLKKYFEPSRIGETNVYIGKPIFSLKFSISSYVYGMPKLIHSFLFLLSKAKTLENARLQWSNPLRGGLIFFR